MRPAQRNIASGDSESPATRPNAVNYVRAAERLLAMNKSVVRLRVTSFLLIESELMGIVIAIGRCMRACAVVHQRAKHNFRLLCKFREPALLCWIEIRVELSNERFNGRLHARDRPVGERCHPPCSEVHRAFVNIRLCFCKHTGLS